MYCVAHAGPHHITSHHPWAKRRRLRESCHKFIADILIILWFWGFVLWFVLTVYLISPSLMILMYCERKFEDEKVFIPCDTDHHHVVLTYK